MTLKENRNKLGFGQPPAVDIANNSATERSDRWYIFRYKVLTTFVKQYFTTTDKEVFFPCQRVRKRSKFNNKFDYLDKPIIPGYIFIRAKLEEALGIAKEIGIPLWRQKFTQLIEGAGNEYVFVRHTAMYHFMKAVELRQQRFEFLDATCIDLEKNDEVKIIDGPFKGVRGYLKTVNGKGGGMVVVPLSFEHRETDSYTLDDIKDVNNVLYYGIPATAKEIAVVAFAKKSRTSIDSIRNARRSTDSMLQQYCNGEDLTFMQQSRLRGYASRFDQVNTTSDIQQANLYMLLYRIYTILDTPTLRIDVLHHIQDVILPAFDERIVTARQCHKAAAIDAKQKYIDQLEETDRAVYEHFQNQQHQEEKA